MQLFKARRVQLAIPFVLLGLVSCQQSTQSVSSRSDIQAVQYTEQVVTIAAVQRSTASSIVYLKGKIGNRAPLLGATAYELQDATGSIWVLTNEPVPNQGDEVLLKGKLQYQTIRLNGKPQSTAYIEQQQLQPVPAIKS